MTTTITSEALVRTSSRRLGEPLLNGEKRSDGNESEENHDKTTGKEEKIERQPSDGHNLSTTDMRPAKEAWTVANGGLLDKVDSI